MIYVGTSGFSYKEWKGSFYPEDLPQSKFLSYYSQHLPTTEINATFYRMPRASVCRKWKEQTPSHFRFTIKMNRKVTHHKKLEDVEGEMEWFLENIEPLEGRLGTVLVQLPPWLKCDLERLGNYLGKWADEIPLAVEFRHESWQNDPQTNQLLEEYGAALVMAETDEQEPVREVTAPFAYARLRRTQYEEEDVRAWGRWLKENVSGDAYVYFKHEEGAPVLARDLMEKLE